MPRRTRDFSNFFTLSALPSPEPGPWHCCRNALRLPAPDTPHQNNTQFRNQNTNIAFRCRKDFACFSTLRKRCSRGSDIV